MVCMRVGGRYRLRNGEVWTCDRKSGNAYRIASDDKQEGSLRFALVNACGRYYDDDNEDPCDVIAEVTDDATSEPQQVESDDVNHPKHYTFGAIEVIDAIEAWKLEYRLGNVVKYVARAEHKGQKLKDLKKAAWYLARVIKQIEEGGAS